MPEITNADESAFPRPAQLAATHDEKARLLLPAQWGLTKREYFAIMALQGLLTQPPNVDKQTDLALEYADALLRKLAHGAANPPDEPR